MAFSSMEEIYYIVSFSLTIIGMLAGIAYWLGRKFAEIDMHFAEINRTLAEMRRDFSRAIDGMKSAVVSANSLILDFMAMKKLLEEGEAGIIKSEIRRVVSIVGLNPLTKEELEFLKKVVEKNVNDITIEEAERIAEIGKRWWYEEGKEEAYKIFLGGLVIRGYLISKMLREGKNPWGEK
jgi:hypothetical protein